MERWRASVTITLLRVRLYAVTSETGATSVGAMAGFWTRISPGSRAVVVRKRSVPDTDASAQATKGRSECRRRAGIDAMQVADRRVDLRRWRCWRPRRETFGPEYDAADTGPGDELCMFNLARHGSGHYGLRFKVLRRLGRGHKPLPNSCAIYAIEIRPANRRAAFSTKRRGPKRCDLGPGAAGGDRTIDLEASPWEFEGYRMV